MKTLKIGNIKLKNPLLLAPMVEVTDLPYRLICRKAGCSMAYTEMIYVSAITHENNKTKKMMETCKEDKPVGIQITGNNSEEFKEVVTSLKGYDVVDINCGCPSIRIAGNKAGSYLLEDPEKIARMIRILKNEGYTTTAKIRLGFGSNNVLKIAKTIEKAGADALTVHARLANQGYSVSADWKQIAIVKNELGITIIGNGDIFNGKDAEQILDVADGAMIARGALGDPLIFSRILKYLKTGKEPEKDLEKNLEYFKMYLKLCKKYDFNEVARTKYVGVSFLKGIQGVGKLRNELMQCKRFDEIQEMIKRIKI